MITGAILAVLVTIAGYIYTAYRGRLHASTQAQFYFAGWSLKTRDVGETVFSSSMSLASVIIALVQLTAFLGMGILFAALTFATGWALFALASRTIIRRHKSIHTLHHFLECTYGSTLLRRTASAATAVGLISLFATELFAVAVLMRALALPESLGTPIVVGLGLIACVHAAEGGFKSVVGTDRLQNRLLMVSVAGLLILALVGWVHADTTNPIEVARHRGLGLSLSLGLGILLINVPYPFVDATAWQRLIAAQDASTFRSGTLWAAGGFILSWAAVICVGLLALTFTPPQSDSFIATLLQAASLPQPLPFVAAFLIFPGFIAAMLSSADAFLNGAAHSLALDFTDDDSIRPNDTVPRRARLRVYALGSAGLASSILLRAIGFDIVSLVFAISAGALSMLPSILGGLILNFSVLKHPIARLSATLSVWVGFAASWVVGIAATTGLSDRLPSPISQLGAYDTPLVALVTSGSIFLIGLTISSALSFLRRT